MEVSGRRVAEQRGLRGLVRGGRRDRRASPRHVLRREVRVVRREGRHAWIAIGLDVDVYCPGLSDGPRDRVVGNRGQVTAAFGLQEDRLAVRPASEQRDVPERERHGDVPDHSQETAGSRPLRPADAVDERAVHRAGGIESPPVTDVGCDLIGLRAAVYFESVVHALYVEMVPALARPAQDQEGP